jgi:hypothetical protein
MHIEEQTLTKGQPVERMKERWNEMKLNVPIMILSCC